jgi:hypothetical protein
LRLFVLLLQSASGGYVWLNATIATKLGQIVKRAPARMKQRLVDELDSFQPYGMFCRLSLFMPKEFVFICFPSFAAGLDGSDVQALLGINETPISSSSALSSSSSSSSLSGKIDQKLTQTKSPTIAKRDALWNVVLRRSDEGISHWLINSISVPRVPVLPGPLKPFGGQGPDTKSSSARFSSSSTSHTFFSDASSNDELNDLLNNVLLVAEKVPPPLQASLLNQFVVHAGIFFPGDFSGDSSSSSSSSTSSAASVLSQIVYRLASNNILFRPRPAKQSRSSQASKKRKPVATNALPLSPTSSSSTSSAASASYSSFPEPKHTLLSHHNPSPHRFDTPLPFRLQWAAHSATLQALLPFNVVTRLHTQIAYHLSQRPVLRPLLSLYISWYNLYPLGYLAFNKSLIPSSYNMKVLLQQDGMDVLLNSLWTGSDKPRSKLPLQALAMALFVYTRGLCFSLLFYFFISDPLVHSSAVFFRSRSRAGSAREQIGYLRHRPRQRNF